MSPDFTNTDITTNLLHESITFNKIYNDTKIYIELLPQNKSKQESNFLKV